MPVKPIFNRHGNKYTKRALITSLIPTHEVYIEPFCGSCAIFLNKSSVKVNILSDLDPILIKHYHLLNEASDDLSLYPSIATMEDIKQWFSEHVDRTDLTIEEQLTLYKIVISTGFQNTLVRFEKNIFRRNNPYITLKHIEKYKDMFSKATFHNEDYLTIIKEYDGVDSFFFLDPPYEKTIIKKQNYAVGSDRFDYNILNTTLLNLKGKFLLTLNDSENIRKIFSTFFMKEVDCVSNGRVNSIRKEVYITNYSLF